MGNRFVLVLSEFYYFLPVNQTRLTPHPFRRPLYNSSSFCPRQNRAGIDPPPGGFPLVYKALQIRGKTLQTQHTIFLATKLSSQLFGPQISPSLHFGTAWPLRAVFVVCLCLGAYLDAQARGPRSWRMASTGACMGSCHGMPSDTKEQYLGAFLRVILVHSGNNGARTLQAHLSVFSPCDLPSNCIPPVLCVYLISIVIGHQIHTNGFRVGSQGNQSLGHSPFWISANCQAWIY